MMAVLVVVRDVSVCHVAVTIPTTFGTLDIAVRYLTEAERTTAPLTSGSITCIVCCIYLCLECQIVDKTFGEHITQLLDGNCVVQFCVVFMQLL